jgi:hypothetical protein
MTPGITVTPHSIDGGVPETTHLVGVRTTVPLISLHCPWVANYVHCPSNLESGPAESA